MRTKAHRRIALKLSFGIETQGTTQPPFERRALKWTLLCRLTIEVAGGAGENEYQLVAQATLY